MSSETSRIFSSWQDGQCLTAAIPYPGHNPASLHLVLNASRPFFLAFPCMHPYVGGVFGSSLPPLRRPPLQRTMMHLRSRVAAVVDPLFFHKFPQILFLYSTFLKGLDHLSSVMSLVVR
jgi:hypothetical protein